MALALAYGPAVGLALVHQLAAEPSLVAYHLLHSVRGDLLARLAAATKHASSVKNRFPML